MESEKKSEKKFHTKNQHYVPQFYFRKFSIDGKNVGLYNISSKKIVPNAPIKHQCSEDYFYGENGVVETALSALEGRFSNLFNKLEQVNASESLPKSMRKNNTLEKIFTKEDFSDLVLFILIQYTRTKTVQKVTDEFLHETLRVILKKEGKPYSESELVKLSLKDSVIHAIQQAIILRPLLHDLKYAVLVNESGTDFLFSDEPVVFQNPLMEKYSKSACVGVASHGLQIYFPISPTRMVCFYDSSVYTFKKQIMSVRSPKDVDALNILQIMSCLSNVYYKQGGVSKEYIESLLPQIVGKTTELVHSGPLIGTQNVVVHVQAKPIHISLKLECFTIKNAALKEMFKAFQENDIQKLNGYHRDEYLLHLLENFSKKIEEKQYKPTEWSKFLDDVEKET